jgi:hypothetical protein
MKANSMTRPSTIMVSMFIVNNWWQVISITVANYGSASCAVCAVADRQTGKNITAIDF